MSKYDNLNYDLEELETAASEAGSSTVITNSNSHINKVKSFCDQQDEIDLDLPSKLQTCRDKIHSIAILLTGSVEDAEEVVEEVFEEVSFNLGDLNTKGYESDKMNSLIHRLTYDASLKKLLIQVDGHAADLVDTSSQILEKQKYLC